MTPRRAAAAQDRERGDAERRLDEALRRLAQTEAVLAALRLGDDSDGPDAPSS